MSVKKYLAAARESAHQRYLNADGFGDMYFANEGEFFNADAAPSVAPAVGNMRTSQPYIILVSNASATTVSNFDVLGAYQYLNNTGFDASGNLTIGNVTISSQISNVSYRELLYQSMNSPFSVGMTYLEVLSGSNSQATTPFTLNTRDANGNEAKRSYIPTIDPYQQQNNMTIVNQLYRIDGFTKLTFSSIAASIQFRIHFYPQDNINIARGLEGRNPSAQFGNPRIVRSSVAVLGGEQVASRIG